MSRNIVKADFAQYKDCEQPYPCKGLCGDYIKSKCRFINQVTGRQPKELMDSSSSYDDYDWDPCNHCKTGPYGDCPVTYDCRGNLYEWKGGKKKVTKKKSIDRVGDIFDDIKADYKRMYELIREATEIILTKCDSETQMKWVQRMMQYSLESDDRLTKELKSRGYDAESVKRFMKESVEGITESQKELDNGDYSEHTSADTILQPVELGNCTHASYSNDKCGDCGRIIEFKWWIWRASFKRGFECEDCEYESNKDGLCRGDQTVCKRYHEWVDDGEPT